jgi:hypothetical protein
MTNRPPLIHFAVFYALLSGCDTPSVKVQFLSADDFPSSVGPPFGLDTLAGGMRGRELSSAITRANGFAGHRLDAALRNTELGVVGQMMFDGDRLGDIVFTFKDCESVRSILTTRWGVASTGTDGMTKQWIWQSAHSHWFASSAQNMTAECRVVFTSSDFFGAKVSAPSELARLAPGLSRKAATEIARDVATSASAVDFHAVNGASQAVAYDARTNRVALTYLILPPRAMLALYRAWGQGAILDGANSRTVWYDKDSGSRATVEDVRVLFDVATPWQDWLGDGLFIAGLGPTNIIGQSIDDLRKERGDDLVPPEPEKLEPYPPFELQVRPSQWDPKPRATITLRNDGSTVTSLAFTLYYDSDATRDSMFRAFEAKWGTSKPSGLGVVFHAGHMTIDVTNLSSALQVTLKKD